jgi:hypothetical protein
MRVFDILKGALGVFLVCNRSYRITFVGLTAHAVLMCQWFAPTELVITFEREGTGRISEEQINKIIVRDAGPDSDVVALNLPLRTVLIANHQVIPHPAFL